VTGNAFLKGHRIRLEISSSNFPRFDRNANTGGPVELAPKLVKANQTVYHDSARPSCLVLTVMPHP
jgi:predicted acyl esterase